MPNPHKHIRFTAQGFTKSIRICVTNKSYKVLFFLVFGQKEKNQTQSLISEEGRKRGSLRLLREIQGFEAGDAGDHGGGGARACSDELAVGDGDGERFAQVRDQGVFAGEGDGDRKAHRKRAIHRWGIPMGHLFLP